MCDEMRLCGVIFVCGHEGARNTTCSTAAVTISKLYRFECSINYSKQ